MTGKNLNKFNLSSTISGSVIAKLRFRTVICQVFFLFLFTTEPNKNPEKKSSELERFNLPDKQALRH